MNELCEALVSYSERYVTPRWQCVGPAPVAHVYADDRSESVRGATQLNMSYL